MIAELVEKSTYTLRPYQQEAVDAGVRFLKSKEQDNGIMVLPTGSGKSIVIAAMVKELNAPTLIFQPSKEILEQNYDKLTSYGYEAGVYSASAGRKDIKQITFATIGSVKSKTHIFKDFKYVIIDECHLVNSKGGMYSDFLNSIKGVKVLGLTATPYRLSTDKFGGSILKFLTRTRPRIFSKVVYYIQNGYLFEQGFLAKLNYYTIKGFDQRKISVNSTGADFDDISLRRYYESINFESEIASIVNRLVNAGRRNILVFTRFITESVYLTKHVKGCFIVTGETSKGEREQILKDFKSGKIRVVCNVGVLTTGFDYPELETVVLARPTMSLSLYYQMIGRGIRPHKEKENCWIVDMCDNIRLFGKVENLVICPDKNEKWYIHNGKKQLTNAYYSRD